LSPATGLLSQAPKVDSFSSDFCDLLGCATLAAGQAGYRLKLINQRGLPPREHELVAREIQEIRDALEAFKTAVEARNVVCRIWRSLVHSANATSQTNFGFTH
jgi:hypothetical protein